MVLTEAGVDDAETGQQFLEDTLDTIVQLTV